MALKECLPGKCIMFVGLERLRNDAFQPSMRGFPDRSSGGKVSQAQPFPPYKKTLSQRHQPGGPFYGCAGYRSKSMQ